MQRKGITTARLIPFIIAFLVVYLLLLPLLGVQLSLIPAAILTCAILALITSLRIANVFPWRLKTSYSVLFLLVALVFTGILNISGILASISAPVATAPVVPGQAPAQGVAECEIPDSLRDDTCSVYFQAYDKTASTTTNVSVPLWIKINGDWQVRGGTSTPGPIDIACGSIVDVWSGNTSSVNSDYYLEPKTGICVNKKVMTVTLDAYKIAAESNLQTTVYDDSGSTALSAGDVEDYKISLGANEEKAVYAKIKINSANVAYRLIGVATVVGKNLSSFKPVGMSSAVTAEFLKDVSIQYNQSNSANTVLKSYSVYKLSEPVMLTQWESKKYQFKIKSSATADPLDTDDSLESTGTSVPFVALIWLDGDYAEDENGNMVLDYYQHDDNENNVGMAEIPESPYGKTGGAFIEVE